MAHVICRDDDVAVWMRAAGDVGRSLFGLRGGAVEVVGCGSNWRGTQVWGVTALCEWLGGGMRFGSTDEGDRGRVAEIVDWVSGCAEQLSGLDRGHDGSSDDCRMGVEHFDWSLVFFCFWRTGRPDVGLSIFASTYHILRVIAE